jgi:hypothetical protein
MDYCPEPGNLPFLIIYTAITMMTIAARIMALFATRPAAPPIIPGNILTAAVVGWAFTGGVAGTAGELSQKLEEWHGARQTG